jgi:hypothetical protein
LKALNPNPTLLRTAYSSVHEEEVVVEMTKKRDEINEAKRGEKRKRERKRERCSTLTPTPTRDCLLKSLSDSLFESSLGSEEKKELHKKLKQQKLEGLQQLTEFTNVSWEDIWSERSGQKGKKRKMKVGENNGTKEKKQTKKT